MSAMTHQIDRLGAGRRVDDSEAFAAGLPARRSPAGGLTPAPHHRFGPGSAPIPTRISLAARGLPPVALVDPVRRRRHFASRWPRTPPGIGGTAGSPLDSGSPLHRCGRGINSCWCRTVLESALREPISAVGHRQHDNHPQSRQPAGTSDGISPCGVNSVVAIRISADELGCFEPGLWCVGVIKI